ncbi:MAG TPA: glycosyltransferase family 1 protein [Candidatus Moranbacteria bacterium]|nr:glycosyltransferase family 1 protein [Candidatus Moranbacteria bacterium]
MKIGIDIRLIGKKQTGSEAVFFNLTKNLAKIDSENEYKLFTDITDKNTLNEIKKSLEIENKNNFEIISLKTKNRFGWNFWTLPKYLRKNPVDFYLTQYITPWFVPKKIKVATIIHDISFNFYPQFIKFWDLIFLKTLIPISLRRADKIIAVSKFTQSEIIKYYKINPEKVDWFYNAVSEDFLKQDVSEEKIKSIKEKYKLPDKYILYIGTLQPRKNIPALIEAFVLLKAELKAYSESNAIKLVIAGGKAHNYDKMIDEVIEKHNLSQETIFPGYIAEEDKGAIMKGAEIFVSPSFYEGFGVPIIEAMSLGVPTIISDIPPHREIAESSALFFNPQIPGELTQKIKETIGSKIIKDNLSRNGKAQVQKFSWEKSAQKLIGIFSKSTH